MTDDEAVAKISAGRIRRERIKEVETRMRHWLVGDQLSEVLLMSNELTVQDVRMIANQASVFAELAMHDFVYKGDEQDD